MNIGHVHQWARENITAGDITGMVAEFVLLSLESAELPSDKLAAISRSFTPIDDDGTLRMEVCRQDVEKLVREVVRARAAVMPLVAEAVVTDTVAAVAEEPLLVLDDGATNEPASVSEL